MKKWLIFLLLISMIGSVEGFVQVQYSLDNATWTNASNTNENYVIIEELENGINENTQYYFRIRNVYTDGSSDWVYLTDRSETSGEIPMGSLAVLGFATFITILVFRLPSRIDSFSAKAHVDTAVRGCIYAFGLMLLSLNTTMAVTISDTLDLGLDQIMFRYLFFINWGIYFTLGIIMIVFGYKTLKEWSNYRSNKKFGYET